MSNLDEDKISIRCSPTPGLLGLIDSAADKQRRARSDWIRQTLHIVATAELSGIDVQELLREYVR